MYTKVIIKFQDKFVSHHLSIVRIAPNKLLFAVLETVNPNTHQFPVKVAEKYKQSSYRVTVALVILYSQIYSIRNKAITAPNNLVLFVI